MEDLKKTLKNELDPNVDEPKKTDNPKNPEDDKGLVSKDNPKDNPIEDDKKAPLEDEDLIAIPKKKLEELRRNAMIEGKRKAAKEEDPEKEELKKKLVEIDTEMKALKTVIKMDALFVQKERQEDLIAIIRGKGLEISEEAIALEVEKHPEWIVTPEKKGIERFGQSSTKEEEEAIKKKEAEEARLRKYFNLRQTK